ERLARVRTVADLLGEGRATTVQCCEQCGVAAERDACVVERDETRMVVALPEDRLGAIEGVGERDVEGDDLVETLEGALELAGAVRPEDAGGVMEARGTLPDARVRAGERERLGSRVSVARALEIDAERFVRRRMGWRGVRGLLEDASRCTGALERVEVL